MSDLTLKQLQQILKEKDYKPELKQAYFLKLIEEIGELAEVLRKNKRLTHTTKLTNTKLNITRRQLKFKRLLFFYPTEVNRYLRVRTT